MNFTRQLVRIGSLKRWFSDASNIKPDHFESSFLNTLHTRGFLYQCTDYKLLDEKCKNECVVAYLGFDATAPSLHVGSLLQIMILRHLQNCGHKPIILMGGGTTKVGDPSGKDESRQLLTEDLINQNIISLRGVFEKFLRIGDNPTDAIIVINADWLNDLKYLDFLRNCGRHITVNRMLSFESVKQRLNREQPLSFLEFNYMLLQAYDFFQLSESHGASLQLGGSDQWGNIVCGVDLARKMRQVSSVPCGAKSKPCRSNDHQVQLYGATAPLVMTSDGRKMGKTADGAVWLNR
jgi:tyrosyl-tRNA synthetase